MSLSAALRDAGLSAEELDQRGLLALPLARAALVGVSQVDRENLDRVWIALCSLQDGDELARLGGALRWAMPPRGKENLALLERYGAGLLPWLATRVEAGVLINHPWCVLPCLLALDDPRALSLLLQVEGVATDGGQMSAWVFQRDPVQAPPEVLAEDAVRTAREWVRRHPDAGLATLAGAARTTPRAAEVLRRMAADAPRQVAERLAALGEGELVAELGLPTALTVDALLAHLDAAAAESWPVFRTGVDGRMEYFALRVIGLIDPASDGWAVVFERLQGCDPDSFEIARYAYGSSAPNGWTSRGSVRLPEALTYGPEEDEEEDWTWLGSTVSGPAGSVVIDREALDRLDLRLGLEVEFGGWPERSLATRAYLATYPDSLWPPAQDARRAAGLPEGQVLVVSTAYAHPSPGRWEPADAPWRVMPSESDALRSLAEALLARDPSRWRPGTSNTDWRLHAAEPCRLVLPEDPSSPDC